MRGLLDLDCRTKHSSCQHSRSLDLPSFACIVFGLSVRHLHSNRPSSCRLQRKASCSILLGCNCGRDRDCSRPKLAPRRSLCVLSGDPEPADGPHRSPMPMEEAMAAKAGRTFASPISVRPSHLRADNVRSHIPAVTPERWMRYTNATLLPFGRSAHRPSSASSWSAMSPERCSPQGESSVSQ